MASSVVIAGAQQTAPLAERQAYEVKVADYAHFAARSVTEASVQTTKNTPFSGEEINESVQTLADGNRIVRNSTGKIYRNSEGRIRREVNGGVSGMMGSIYSTGMGVSITSPSVGERYLLESNLKTAGRLLEMPRSTVQGLTVLSTKETTAEEKEKIAQLKVELDRVRATAPVAIFAPNISGLSTVYGNSGQGGVVYTGPITAKYETRTEELGTRDFEGVMAEGTRRITTIPADAIGNERPIETVYERWYSKELGMVVYSKNTDPRFGEQTYRLTNLVRAEPDPSLFTIRPAQYRKTGEPDVVYRVSGTKPAPVTKSTIAARPAQSTPAVKIKP